MQQKTGNTFHARMYSDKWSLYQQVFLIFSFSGESDRDVFNEKPSREEILAATQASDVLGAFSSDFILEIVRLNLLSSNISNLSESSQFFIMLVQFQLIIFILMLFVLKKHLTLFLRVQSNSTRRQKINLKQKSQSFDLITFEVFYLQHTVDRAVHQMNFYLVDNIVRFVISELAPQLAQQAYFFIL